MSAQMMREFVWLVRREFWEHRSFFVVPVVALAILLIASLFSLVQGARFSGLISHAVDHIHLLEKGDLPVAGEVVMAVMGILFMLAMGIVAVFYLLDCLYSERRDRSVLFWKSLPLSDTTTVLSKFFVGVVMLPIISALAAFVGYVCLLIMGTVAFAIGGEFPLGPLWNPLNLIKGLSKTLSLEMIISMWYLPISAWLVFCSAFARKAPFLWAALTPAAIILAENLLFGHSWLAQTIGEYFAALGTHLDSGVDPHRPQIDFSNGRMSVEGSMVDVSSSTFGVFTDVRLYAGAALAALLVSATIWWRRNKIQHD